MANPTLQVDHKITVRPDGANFSEICWGFPMEDGTVKHYCSRWPYRLSVEQVRQEVAAFLRRRTSPSVS